MQCTSPIVNFAPSEDSEKLDDQAIKKAVHHTFDPSTIHTNNPVTPFSKINQSFSRFAPVLPSNKHTFSPLVSKTISQLDFFPLSPQLTSSPTKQTVHKSPSLTAFHLDRDIDIPSISQSEQSTEVSNSRSAPQTDQKSSEPAMQRVHREKSIRRSPMRTRRLSQSIDSSSLNPPLSSPAGEPITVELAPDQALSQAIVQSHDSSRMRSLNKELDESINDVATVKLDQSANQSSNESPLVQSPNHLTTTGQKVDDLLKEVDSALFGQDSLANELAQARKEDEVDQSISQSTNQLPGVQFNQSISRLLDDDSLVDEVPITPAPSPASPSSQQASQSFEQLDNQLIQSSTTESSTQRSVTQFSEDVSSFSPSINQSINESAEQVSSITQPIEPADSTTHNDFHVVGKQVPVRFVIPPVGQSQHIDLTNDQSKQTDVDEAVQAIPDLFSPSSNQTTTQHLDQSSSVPSDLRQNDSDRLINVSNTQPITETFNQRITQPVKMTFKIESASSSHMSTTPLTVAEASSKSSDIATKVESSKQVDLSTSQSINQSISPSNQMTNSPVGDRTKITVTPPTPLTQSVTPLIDESYFSPDLSVDHSANRSDHQSISPSPSQSISDDVQEQSQVDEARGSNDVTKLGQRENDSIAQTDLNDHDDETKSSSASSDVSEAPRFGERTASGDLQIMENHRPFINQQTKQLTEQPISPVEESENAPRTIPPSMSELELHQAILSRISSPLDSLSVDVPNECGAMSPQAMAARRLLQAELAKPHDVDVANESVTRPGNQSVSPVSEPVNDVEIEPTNDENLKVDIHPIKKSGKRARKDKRKVRATPSPPAAAESIVPEGSIAEGSTSSQQSKPVRDNLPEPSEELHEVSRQYDNEPEPSPVAPNREDVDMEKLAAEDNAAYKKKDEHDTDELSIDAQRENEPRLYSVPELTPYNPHNEWSPDAEREKTGQHDKYFTEKNESHDTHDNALLGLEAVEEEPKAEVAKKLPSPPSQSSTQDEEEFWRLQAEEYAFEYPRTAVTFVHMICAQSPVMRFLFACCLVLNLVVPLTLFLHTNEAQITILCQLLTFACAYWVYAKYDFVTAVFASQSLLLPSIIFIYESFVKETSFLEFIAVIGTFLTSPRLWWDTSLLCYLWLCAAVVLQTVCLVGGATIAFRGR